jgi:hypothetical protein
MEEARGATALGGLAETSATWRIAHHSSNSRVALEFHAWLNVEQASTHKKNIGGYCRCALLGVPHNLIACAELKQTE